MATSNFITQKDFDLYATTIFDTTEEEYYEQGLDYVFEELQNEINEINDKLDFFKITLKSGYYAGIQTFVEQRNKYNEYDEPLYIVDNYDNLDKYDSKDIYKTYGYNKYILKRKIEKEIKLINNKYLKSLQPIYDFDCYRVVGRFSNGETIYEKVEN